MSFSGADVDELRALATRFDHQAARLRELAGSSSAAIMTAAWSGAKIDDVRSEWNRTSKPKILAVAAAFAGLATDLRRQAGEQSAASGGSLGGMTRLDIPDLPWPFTFLNPDTIPGTIGPLPWRIPDFGEFFPQLIAVGGMIPDGIEFIEALGRGGSLNGLTSVVDDIATFKPAAFLSLIGMGFSAHDLGVALAEGDEAGTFEASLDLIAGGLGFFVPGAGVAWEAGKLIGETGYNAVQPFWNTTDSMWNSAVEDVFGPGVNPNDLTPEQADVMVRRYEGPLGMMNSISDGMRGAGKDFGHAVGNLAGGVAEGVGDLAGGIAGLFSGGGR